MKLSKAQEKAMKVLSDKWQSSYTMGIGLKTLEALERKGLVQSVGGVGSIFSPTTVIKWRLVPQYPPGIIPAGMRVQIRTSQKVTDYGTAHGTVEAETIDRFDKLRTELRITGEGFAIEIAIDTDKLVEALDAGGMEAILGDKTRKEIDDNMDGG